jgi:Dihaem cytochrome c
MHLLERKVAVRKFSRLIILAFSFFLALSVFQDISADDDHYKKRHRYRGGSQEVDDDHDDHDRDADLKPVTDQTYKEACGQCHFAYQPELLPSASWLKILNQLNDHFGEEIEIDPDTRKIISDYLKSNGAESSSAKPARKIMRSLANNAPLRITEIPYIREKHHEISASVLKRKSIGSLSNCSACHTTAEQGIYDDDRVKIPQ